MGPPGVNRTCLPGEKSSARGDFYLEWPHHTRCLGGVQDKGPVEKEGWFDPSVPDFATPPIIQTQPSAPNTSTLTCQEPQTLGPIDFCGKAACGI